MKKVGSEAEPPTHRFMCIRELEFPRLFKNPIVKHQKMSKFLDEQDFNSDTETIERNRGDLLKQVTSAIDSFVRSDPTKVIQNLKEHNPETDAAKLKAHVEEVKRREADSEESTAESLYS